MNVPFYTNRSRSVYQPTDECWKLDVEQVWMSGLVAPLRVLYSPTECYGSGALIDHGFSLEMSFPMVGASGCSAMLTLSDTPSRPHE